MRGPTFKLRREMGVSCDPGLVWALVADTNRLNRAMGQTRPTLYRQGVVDGIWPAQRPVGVTRYLFIPMEWVEMGEWIEGRSLLGQRRFVRGPLELAQLRVEVTPAGSDGSRVAVESLVRGRPGPWGFICAVYALVLMWWRMPRYLAAVRSLLLTPEGRALCDEPAALRGRAHVARQPGLPPLVGGGRRGVSSETLARRAAAFAGAPVSPPLRERIVTFVRDQSDEAVAEMRPLELARAWGEPPREVLRAFLHAARAGLVDLRWVLNCPACRVGAATAPRLGEVGSRQHCELCQIDFDVDFAGNVEALFAVNQAVRPAVPVRFCQSSPWYRPHAWGAALLGPREARVISARPPGGTLVRVYGAGRAAATVPADGGARVRLRSDGSLDAEPGAAGLELVNERDEEVILLVERAGWSGDAALGSLVLTLPEFHQFYGVDAPAAGLDLKVGTVTVLFADLVASTALYERIGDARAYALVQEHFRAAEAALLAHEGALVKTMGDGLLAVFTRPADALAASIGLIQAAERIEARERVGFAVRVGVHEGSCFIVNANQRLDLFGTAVNLAARLQTQAVANQVAFKAELLQQPAVVRLLEEAGPRLACRSAELRGLQGQHRIAVLDWGATSMRPAAQA
jgi:class 3 adenylate cyclase